MVVAIQRGLLTLTALSNQEGQGSSMQVVGLTSLRIMPITSSGCINQNWSHKTGRDCCPCTTQFCGWFCQRSRFPIDHSGLFSIYLPLQQGLGVTDLIWKKAHRKWLHWCSGGGKVRVLEKYLANVRSHSISLQHHFSYHPCVFITLSRSQWRSIPGSDCRPLI